MPKIGVALSSGGAAGMAHVGVLEELEKAGIPVSCVAGTSAGAMVGAAYAAGHMEGFRDTMCGLSRSRVLRLFDPTWPRLGLFEGRRALDLIRPYVGERIEDLPLPYAAVATDLRLGTEVVLRRGSVLEAVRASAAVPGLFTPERLSGRLLVDGGLVNPLPVDVARRLGAEFVIAVSVLSLPEGPVVRREQESGLTTQLLARFLERHSDHETEAGHREPAPTEEDQSPELGLLEVLARATSVVQAQVALTRLREEAPDYFLSIPLPQIGIFDFHKSVEAVEAGRLAARGILEEIEQSLEGNSLTRQLTRWLEETTTRLRRRR